MTVHRLHTFLFLFRLAAEKGIQDYRGKKKVIMKDALTSAEILVSQEIEKTVLLSTSASTEIHWYNVIPTQITDVC